MSSVVQLRKDKASSAGSSPRKGKAKPFTGSASLASADFTKNSLLPVPTPIAARPGWGTGSALQSTWIQRLIPISRSFKQAEASEVRNGVSECRARQVDIMDLEEDTAGDGEAGTEELQSLEGCAAVGNDRKKGISHKYGKHPYSQAEKPNMVKCFGSSSILHSTPDSCRTVECMGQKKPSLVMPSKVKLPKVASPRLERSITLGIWGNLPASSDSKIVAPVAIEDGQASAVPFKPAEKNHVAISPGRLGSSVWFARIAGKGGCMGAAPHAATHFVKSSDSCTNLSSTPFYHQNGPEENMTESDNKGIRSFPPLKSGEQWPGTPKPSGLTPLRIPWNGKSGRGNGQDNLEELPLLTPINVPFKLAGEKERLQVRGEEVARTPPRSFSLFQTLEEPRQSSTSSCTRSLPSEFINDLYSKNHRKEGLQGASVCINGRGKGSPVSVANQSASSDTKTLYLNYFLLDGDAACANSSLEGASSKKEIDVMKSNKNKTIEEKRLHWIGPDSNENWDTATFTDSSKLQATSFLFPSLDDQPKRHEDNEFKIGARPLKTALEAKISQRELGTTQTILEANSKQAQDAKRAFVHPTGVPCSVSVTGQQGSQQWLQRWSSSNCNSRRLRALEQARDD